MFEEGILEGRNIAVGVTGSIAIYKALELIRLYKKSGANVKVVMSEGAKRFISPLTFEALTREEVLTEESESWANSNNHIDIGKWADIFVVAPATANTINKLSNGIADNLLTQALLAYPKPKLLAPSANTNMYKNPVTTGSLKMIQLLNYEIIDPVKKVLACMDEGEGALADVEDIFLKTAQILLRDDYWRDRRVVVTAGGTIERIDDVRYISNFSSGKMGAALAKALYIKGADVCLITTKKGLVPNSIYTIEVESSEEMKEYLVDAIRVAKKGVMSKATLMDTSEIKVIQKKPYLFMAAAVSDYKPKFKQEGKLKKDILGEHFELELVKSEDILSSLDKSGIYSVGFKAEISEDGLQNAKEMLLKKDLDAVCFNDVSEHHFGSDQNHIILIDKEGEYDLGVEGKLSLSLKLLDRLKALNEPKESKDE